MCGLLFRKGAADKNPEPEEKRKAEVGSGSTRGSQLAAGFAAPGSGFLWSVGKEVERLPGRKKKRGSGQYKSTEMREM